MPSVRVRKNTLRLLKIHIPNLPFSSGYRPLDDIPTASKHALQPGLACLSQRQPDRVRVQPNHRSQPRKPPITAPQSFSTHHVPIFRQQAPPHSPPPNPIRTRTRKLTCVLNSNTSLNPIPIDANRLCNSITTLLLCSSTCGLPSFPFPVPPCPPAPPGPFFEDRTYDCKAAICVLRDAISCRMI